MSEKRKCFSNYSDALQDYNKGVRSFRETTSRNRNQMLQYMEKYERETGRKAIVKNRITDDFVKSMQVSRGLVEEQVKSWKYWKKFVVKAPDPNDPGTWCK
jgi:predicted transcriptional regulator